MVIDTIENLKNYIGVNPLFADVVKFIEENDLASMEDGKYIIKGNDLFVNITTAKGKTPDEAVMETHVKMIDIQIPSLCRQHISYLLYIPKCFAYHFYISQFLTLESVNKTKKQALEMLHQHFLIGRLMNIFHNLKKTFFS